MNETGKRHTVLRRLPARTASAVAVALLAAGTLVQTPVLAGDGQRGGGRDWSERHGGQGGGCEAARRGGHGGSHHGSSKGHARMGGHEGMGMLRGLDLTEAQRDKLFELRYAQMPAMREHRKAVRAARQGLRELGSAESYDAERAKTYAEQLGLAVAAMALQKTTLHQAMLAVLTDEQRAELKQRRDRAGERRGMYRDGQGMRGDARGMHRDGQGMRGDGRGMGGDGRGMQGSSADKGKETVKGQGAGTGQSADRSES